MDDDRASASPVLAVGTMSPATTGEKVSIVVGTALMLLSLALFVFCVLTGRYALAIINLISANVTGISTGRLAGLCGWPW